MKLLTLILVIFLLPLLTKGQLVEIPVSKISGQHVKSLRCNDSTLTVSEVCPLGAGRIYVVFFSSFVNKTDRIIRLIGRVKPSNDVTSGGIAGVEIFKGKLVGGKLTNRVKLTETTYEKDYMNNDGFLTLLQK